MTKKRDKVTHGYNIEYIMYKYSYTNDMGLYVVEHEYYNSVDCAGQPA